MLARRVQRRVTSGLARRGPAIRKRAIRWLDRVVFRLDTTRYLIDKPTLDYQPAPWAGVDEAGVRGDGTYARWELISTHLPREPGRIAVDIGCCYGFFSIKMAELGYEVVGIDLDPRYVRIARHATPEELGPHCNFMQMTLTPDNVSVVPPADVVLCMSVWHHWVFDYGIEDATEMLGSIWENTRAALFFESGEDTDKEEFHLPFGDQDGRFWIANYLGASCPGSSVEVIGETPVGKYEKYGDSDERRALFVVARGQ